MSGTKKKPLFLNFQLMWPWHCERRCPSLSSGSDQNVILLAGDRMLSADCDIAHKMAPISLSNPSRRVKEDDSTLWSDYAKNRNSVLMASCTHLEIDGDEIMANDCVNGSLVPRVFLEEWTNYTQIHRVFERHGASHRLDHRGRGRERIPFDTDITIYNRTKVNKWVERLVEDKNLTSVSYCSF